MQSRLESIVEACLNVLSGMLLAFAISQIGAHYEAEIQTYIWSGFKWDISPSSNAIMTCVLTVVSVIRGYTWRRFFTRRRKK